MAPLMILTAYLGLSTLFIVLYAANLLTDALDGFLARHLHAESQLGAMLDSRGDMAVALCLPLSVFLLWPDMIREITPYVIIAVCAYLAPVIIGHLRYGKIPSFHTWAAKILAVVAGICLLMMFITQNTIYFRAIVPLLILESLEELAMIAILPEWSPNTPTLLHAIRTRTAK